MKKKNLNVHVQYQILQSTILSFNLFLKFAVIGLIVIPLWKMAYGPAMALQLFNLWGWSLGIFVKGIIPISLVADLICIWIIIKRNKKCHS